MTTEYNSTSNPYSLIYFLILFFILMPLQCLAHKPVDTSVPATRDDPIIIKNHQLSQAAYTALSKEGETDYFRLEAELGDKIDAELVIPKFDRLKNFEPLLGIVGSGIESDLNGISVVKVKKIVDIKNNEGIVLKRYQSKTSREFFEPFTQTRYWKKQKLSIISPSNSTYFLVVFDPTGQSGKYVLSIGKKEKWGLKDILKLPLTWWNVKIFMEQKVTTYLIAGTLILTFFWVILKYFF